MQRIETITASDLSGQEPAEPVTFSFGSAHYEIDLTREERTDLMRLLQPYIDNARKAPKRKPTTRR